MIQIDGACEFEQLKRDGALRYHRCKNCQQVLPSFDPPERTYWSPCPKAGLAVTPLPWYLRNRWSVLALSFLDAMRRWVLSGFARPSADDLAARAEACRLCPLQQFLGPRGAVERCASCGCWLPLKRRMATATCPGERWPGQRHAHGQGLVMTGGKLQSSCGCGGAQA